MFTSRRAISMAHRRFQPRQAQQAAVVVRRLYATEASGAQETTTSTEAANVPSNKSATNSTPQPASKPARATPKAPAKAAPAKPYSRHVPPPPAAANDAPTSSARKTDHNPAARGSSTNATSKRAALESPRAQHESRYENYSPRADVIPATAVDWADSFHGIGAKPVSKEQFKTIIEPLPLEDIEVKPDGIVYLPEIKYRRRLNDVFGPMGWGMVPRGEPVVGESIVTREYALIADSRFVAQVQGENNYFGADSLPSAIEGCKSNALMRCCKDLGIASELWDPQFIRWFKEAHMQEVWVEHAVTKKKRTLWYKKGQVDVAYPYKAT